VHQAIHRLKRGIFVFGATVTALVASRILLYALRNRGRPVVIVCGEYGRLGNALVRFAHLIAAAREQGFDVFDFSIGRYAFLFESLSGNFLCEYPEIRRKVFFATAARRILSLVGKLFSTLKDHPLKPEQFAIVVAPQFEYDFSRADGYSEDFLSDFNCDVSGKEFLSVVSSNRVTTIHGWRFRNWPNFDSHAEPIRNFFLPRAQLIQDVEAEMARARGLAEILVGVHVRGTDFKNWLGGRFYLKIEDYRRRLEEVSRLFAGKVGFFVASDELIESSAWADLGPVFSKKRSILEDLHGLSLCDYILGPPSTYSGWAAFAGKKPLCWIKPANRSFETGAKLLYEQKGDHMTLDDFREVVSWRGVEVECPGGGWFIL
jgi:hypothetical protein